MKVLTVSELAKNINYFLENLGEVWVEGETSNVRYSSLGHIYFTLKDEDAQIECVVFRGRRSRIQFRIEEGKKYRLRGSVEFWAKGGRLSIIVEEMLPYGIGELALKFELLKKKLDKEGLFDPAHKKPLPKYPLVIGIVTSREGAALRDMVRNLRNRFPPVRIILRPSLVQGENAAEDIAKGIEEFNEYGGVDLIIIGRGGGSLEDLWPFNEEIVARAIFNSKIPIISAVGHETDFSISDFVADRRAATPTEAAVIAVRNATEILNEAYQMEKRMHALIKRRLAIISSRLIEMEKRRVFKDPMLLVEKKSLAIDHNISMIIEKIRRRLNREWSRINGLKVRPPSLDMHKHRIEQFIQKMNGDLKHRLSYLNSRIDGLNRQLFSLSPESILFRGYTLVFRDGELIKDGNALNKDDKIKIRFRDGERNARIDS